MNAIQVTILAAITAASPKGCDWDIIVAAVNKDHKIRKNGWMAVRNCLQGLINAGIVYRSSDVHTEEYSLR